MKTLLKKVVKAILPYGILCLYRKIKERTAHNDMQKNADIFSRNFLKTKEDGECYFEIAGAKLPNLCNYSNKINDFIYYVFQDTFFFPYFLNDNYDRSLVEILDLYMVEGPYGYKDGDFDVSVQKGDVVMDVGAWIGDFSAYASSKGATSYAFEPVDSVYELLQKTAELNANIYPVRKGLSDKVGKVSINVPSGWEVASSISAHRNNSINETISITTLDEFVKENKIPKVDFIKADIEGEERNMLKGASWVLKKYAPKLAICTYHNPEDPQLLEKIILEANPEYKIVHLKKKLFAQVVK
ncbi:MAG: FkbM family methyltransferase [Fibromonadaceae bacterium]|jgi:FkbM family methyltransferase|nr:FkbM family methyltransferase [Fibromonadaceae bacterium]